MSPGSQDRKLFPRSSMLVGAVRRRARTAAYVERAERMHGVEAHGSLYPLGVLPRLADPAW